MDGIFQKQVQKAFNAILPEDLSTKLSDLFPIGAPDSSISSDLVVRPVAFCLPPNHRLRALSHDPILGIIFGIKDMLNGTLYGGSEWTDHWFILPVKALLTKPIFSGSSPECLDTAASDVNALSKRKPWHGFTGSFYGATSCMFEGSLWGVLTGKQIEYMYVNGYDFRQYIVTSIPMTIMEVLMRVFYVVKQVSLGKRSFWETLLDTMPLWLNPHFLDDACPWVMELPVLLTQVNVYHRL